MHACMHACCAYFDGSATAHSQLPAYCGCALLWVSVSSSQRTSAISLNVIGNVKDAMKIVLSVLIFHDHLSVLNVFGVLVVLCAASAYSAIRTCLRGGGSAEGVQAKAEATGSGGGSGGGSGDGGDGVELGSVTHQSARTKKQGALYHVVEPAGGHSDDSS